MKLGFLDVSEGGTDLNQEFASSKSINTQNYLEKYNFYQVQGYELVSRQLLLELWRRSMPSSLSCLLYYERSFRWKIVYVGHSSSIIAQIPNCENSNHNHYSCWAGKWWTIDDCVGGDLSAFG